MTDGILCVNLLNSFQATKSHCIIISLGEAFVMRIHIMGGLMNEILHKSCGESKMISAMYGDMFHSGATKKKKLFSRYLQPVESVPWYMRKVSILGIFGFVKTPLPSELRYTTIRFDSFKVV